MAESFFLLALVLALAWFVLFIITYGIKSIEVTYTLQNWIVKPTEAKKLNDTEKEKLRKKLTQKLLKVESWRLN